MDMKSALKEAREAYQQVLGDLGCGDDYSFLRYDFSERYDITIFRMISDSDSPILSFNRSSIISHAPSGMLTVILFMSYAPMLTKSVTYKYFTHLKSIGAYCSMRKSPRKRVGKLCLYCREIFEIAPSVIERGYGKFCSNKCRYAYHTKKLKKVCEECGKSFYIVPSRLTYGFGRFCTQKCSATWHCGDNNPTRRPEVRRKISESRKGRPSWNLGLTKETDERVRKYGENGSKTKTGRTKERYEYIKRQSKKLKGITWEMRFGVKKSRELKKKFGEVRRVTKENSEWRRRQAESLKKLWADRSFKNKRVKAIIKGGNIRPNKKEQELDDILQQILPNEYKYVGDGKVIICGLIPDFICNCKKKVIELFGEYWHNNNKTGWKRTEFGRKSILNQLGYDCLIVWQDELKTKETLVDKIMEFHMS